MMNAGDLRLESASFSHDGGRDYNEDAVGDSDAFGAVRLFMLADGAGDLICTLAKIAQGAFFAWSPDGVHLALLDSPAPLSEPAAIEIYDARDGSHHQAHEQASAFFWSPDGQSLVVYSLRSGVAATVLDAAPPAIVVDTAQVDPVLRIEAVDAASGRAVFVADTLPTRSFAQYLPFFDQYSRAVTPWSPDGRRLVFATRDTADHSSIAQATFPAGPLGAPSLSMVAPGGLAFYSPK